jgi:hypothetical protein
MTFGAGGTLWCRRRSCATPAISIWNGATRSRPELPAKRAPCRRRCDDCRDRKRGGRLRPGPPAGGQASVAARTLAPPVELPRRRRCRWPELKRQSEHASIPDAAAAGATRRQSAPAVAQTGTTSSAAGGSASLQRNVARARRCRRGRDVRATAQASPKTPNKKVREAARARDPAPAASWLRVRRLRTPSNRQRCRWRTIS